MRTPAELAETIAPLVAEFSGIELAILFGSGARGTGSSRSDVDLAVRGDVDRLALAAAVSDACGREVDVVDLNRASIPLLEAIVRDGRKVFERTRGEYATWRSRAMWMLETDLPNYRRMRDAWLKKLAEGR